MGVLFGILPRTSKSVAPKRAKNGLWEPYMRGLFKRPFMTREKPDEKEVKKMELTQCFRALGFCEMPASREEVEAAYEKRRKIGGVTESEKLAARLLEENYRACLRCLDGG